MAIIHMKMAIGYIREELAQESRNELMKSMKYWADMPPGLSSDYEMTIRLKCKLHIYFN